MKKEQFLQQLESLLSDLSQEERQEAMAYYQGYFDDAGEENEAAVMAELKSPEHVARIIQAGLRGNAAGGSFTESGYDESDEKEVPARRNLSNEEDASEETKQRTSNQSTCEYGYSHGYETGQNGQQGRTTQSQSFSGNGQYYSGSRRSDKRPVWVTVLLTLAGVAVIVVLAIVMLCCILVTASFLGAGIALGIFGAPAAGAAVSGISLIFLAIFVLALLGEVLFCRNVMPKLSSGDRRRGK